MIRDRSLLSWPAAIGLFLAVGSAGWVVFDAARGAWHGRDPAAAGILLKVEFSEAVPITAEQSSASVIAPSTAPAIAGTASVTAVPSATVVGSATAAAIQQNPDLSEVEAPSPTPAVDPAPLRPSEPIEALAIEPSVPAPVEDSDPDPIPTEASKPPAQPMEGPPAPPQAEPQVAALTGEPNSSATPTSPVVPMPADFGGGEPPRAGVPYRSVTSIAYLSTTATVARVALALAAVTGGPAVDVLPDPLVERALSTLPLPRRTPRPHEIPPRPCSHRDRLCLAFVDGRPLSAASGGILSGLGIGDHRLPIDPQLADRELRCLAFAAFTEAGGEGSGGMAAVVWVIANRARASEFSAADACSVVAESGQFEPMRRPRFADVAAAIRKGELPPSPRTLSVLDALSLRAARLVVWRMATGTYYPEDPTEGALFFLAPDTMRALGRSMPPWVGRMELTAEIGDHAFYRPRRR